ncbi:RNA-binding region RNP-1 domain-containing protein [Heterostelium album PN500]|uniref:RNA-binding region RNP-1 domain-containing protein n=1 Tax=Heterostelium pallidum (strain ATCC 26659 / Pp 5 / PN500) TaxID=670386 RepID=D3BUM7_HETP5|nr:RNA-binding region RNP-1 domain-containing protein [Heterostelium album PN500]EFA74815.1 RNA-binding region RNP-1 domain-containing protein [Heterostelium album PN500]|eukprot:XP_020426949.1 RNA-binding region RNP-1 domain-containing protein [Heterostelium album PN500]
MDALFQTDSPVSIEDDLSNVPDSDNNVIPYQQQQQQHQYTKEPMAENEVFVGGVSKNVTEDDLQSVFNSVGSVRQIRLMKNKLNGESKGYAFITFEDKSSCQMAVEKISNKELKGKSLRVKYSENRRKLFLGNLPKEFNKEQLLEILNKHTEGITSMDFLMDPDNPTRNRGFAFVEFSDYYLADKARKEFASPSFRIGSSCVTVNWADPVQEPDEDVMKNVRVLYVRNLPEQRNSEDLKKVFEEFGTIEKVIIPVNIPGQQRRDFGFVHFESREAAEEALVRHNNQPITYQGRDLIVSFAKPMDKKQRAELRVRKLQRTVNRQNQNAVKQLHQIVPTLTAGVPQNIAIQPGISFFQLQSAPTAATAATTIAAAPASALQYPQAYNSFGFTAAPASYSLYPIQTTDSYLSYNPSEVVAANHRYKPY